MFTSWSLPADVVRESLDPVAPDLGVLVLGARRTVKRDCAVEARAVGDLAVDVDVERHQRGHVLVLPNDFLAFDVVRDVRRRDAGSVVAQTGNECRRGTGGLDFFQPLAFGNGVAERATLDHHAVALGLHLGDEESGRIPTESDVQMDILSADPDGHLLHDVELRVDLEHVVAAERLAVIRVRDQEVARRPHARHRLLTPTVGAGDPLKHAADVLVQLDADVREVLAAERLVAVVVHDGPLEHAADFREARHLVGGRHRRFGEHLRVRVSGKHGQDDHEQCDSLHLSTPKEATRLTELNESELVNPPNIWIPVSIDLFINQLVQVSIF